MSTLAAEISALMAVRQLTKAEDLARRACEQQPGDATAWYLQAAVHSMQSNWLDVARCCREVLALDPAHVEARYNLGAALASLSQYPEATTHFRSVIGQDPGFAPAHLALANCLSEEGSPAAALGILRTALKTFGASAELLAAEADLLLETGQTEAAVHSYQRALELSPRDASVQYRLGCAFQRLGRPADAQRHLEAAIAINPGLTDAHGQLGATFAETGRWADAIRCFNQVLALEPDHLSALVNLGAALRASGQPAAAADVYRRAGRRHPESELARYFAAIAGSEAVPKKSPAAYVSELFDSYASRFEEHLVAKLRYQTPALIATTLAEVLGPAARDLATLDLGCGTGLVGLALGPIAGRLTGVDLSQRMIERVAQRALYDDLHVAEIGAFLHADAGRYDLLVAADVFIYVGEIGQILADGAARLRPGGLFVFSVERHPGNEPYVLRESGRYAQSPGYVRACGKAAGLTELRAVEHVVRIDGETPLVGDLFVFRL